MKATELRHKTKDELNSLLLDLARERFNLRMQKSTGQLSKPSEAKRVRREMARIQTVMNEKAGA